MKKGMVVQRALQYSEVDTEWMLLPDDSVMFYKMHWIEDSDLV